MFMTDLNFMACFNSMFMIFLDFMACLTACLSISQFYGMFMIYLNFMAFLTCPHISQFNGMFNGMSMIHLNFKTLLTACLWYTSISWHVYDPSQFYVMFQNYLMPRYIHDPSI